MRTKEELPATPLEVAIAHTLMLDGIKQEDIQFRGGPNHSHKGKRYLRVGYWEQISKETYSKLEKWVSESYTDDDDTLPKYSYDFKPEANNKGTW